MYGATVGRLGLLNVETTTNQAICAILNDKGFFENRYIFFYLLSIRKKMLKDSFGGAQPNLSQAYIKNLDIPLPPLAEQKRIVQKLDALFERIDKAIALLQKNINAADNFMNSVLNDVFSDLEQRNGLVQINDIVVKTKNKNPMDGNNQLFTYIDISSIDNNLFKIVEPKTLQTCEAPSRARKEIRLGDIVYSTTRPNLKNIAIVDKVYDNPIASTGFCVLRVNQKANNRFLFYYLITSHLFTQIEPKIRGAQYPAISDSDLKDCFISNALLSVQQKVVAYLDNVLVKIEQVKSAQQQKMQNLLDLKLSILDQAFHGKL